ncbi:LOW QUALITY PROTEIN: hypothetical protein HID58_049261 [Brassica napus]|uniref:Uncharacterized protein n=1 Tax=Brassica napus TaxID=3708 RepID=A0ABQ8B5G3_BRANA|nr:LOW QUALITY PROTEIN: hypothetical protein HID58_049261 [Brassica napus]
MSTEGLSRGPGPFEHVTGWIWVFMTSKKAGLMGRGLFGSGFKAVQPLLTTGQPIEPHLEASTIPLLSSPENEKRERVKGDGASTTTVRRNGAPPMAATMLPPSGDHIVLELHQRSFFTCIGRLPPILKTTSDSAHDSLSYGRCNRFWIVKFCW